MKRHPRSFWVELVAEVEAGATVAEVARRRRVREGTLRWWRSQLRGERADRSQRLLPVVPVAASSVGAVEVALGDVRLRLEVGTDVAYVGALARALRAAC
jgi:transposase-like protein